MSEAVAVFVVVSCSNLAHMRFVVAGSCAVDCSNQTAPRRGRRGTLGERRRGRDWRGNGVGGGVNRCFPAVPVPGQESMSSSALSNVKGCSGHEVRITIVG